MGCFPSLPLNSLLRKHTALHSQPFGHMNQDLTTCLGSENYLAALTDIPYELIAIFAPDKPLVGSGCAQNKEPLADKRMTHAAMGYPLLLYIQHL